MNPYLTDEESEELRRHFPDLWFDRSHLVVLGELAFHMYYDGSRLRINAPHQADFREFSAYYNIEIDLKHLDESGFPIVREVAGKIEKVARGHGIELFADMHISQDGTCCLSALYFVNPRNYSFMRFLNELVCSYFAWHAHLEAFGEKAPWGEYSHFGEGRNERLREILATGRNGPCFCGSGKKLKHCCVDKQQQIWRQTR